MREELSDFVLLALLSWSVIDAEHKLAKLVAMPSSYSLPDIRALPDCLGFSAWRYLSNHSTFKGRIHRFIRGRMHDTTSRLRNTWQLRHICYTYCGFYFSGQRALDSARSDLKKKCWNDTPRRCSSAYVVWFSRNVSVIVLTIAASPSSSRTVPLAVE